MSTTHFRFPDLAKAVAANLIVLHHLAFYGPMSDHVRPLVPELMGWLDQYARVAVQVFLAIGGFLAAKSLSHGAQAPFSAIGRRFTKLVPPFIVAMLIAVSANALASLWMNHSSLSAPPTLGQVLAHATLLHSVLGYESLSAGVWYVAIDFQLYAALALMLWMVRPWRNRWSAPALVAAAASVSLLVFNLDPQWDVWAPYFFGSYGLGALAWWASERRCGTIGSALLTGIILLLGGLALEEEFRVRIAVALATSLALVGACRGMLWIPGQNLRVTAFLGRVSYGIFLMHFPVSLVVNAAFTHFAPALPEVQAAGMLLAWMASIAAGAAFHRWVEIPLGEITSGSRAGRNNTLQPLA